jgi:predicted nucleotidyltransferase
MIKEQDKEIIIKYAKKYGVSSVYLFGSSLDDSEEVKDIDLAVKGLMPNNFLKFYGILLSHLSKPVDLVDLSKKSYFNHMVQEIGLKTMKILLNPLKYYKRT